MRVGRNDPCPCGSGNKFKNCCVGKSSRMSRGVIALIVVVATIAAIGLIPSLLSGGKPVAAVNAIRPGPSSPRQAASQSGRVWSAEHKHWHDASGQAASSPVAQTAPQPAPPQQQPSVVTTGNTPQPPGPAPAGQVWSTEHGHWHAAPK